MSAKCQRKLSNTLDKCNACSVNRPVHSQVHNLPGGDCHVNYRMSWRLQPKMGTR